jgi:hypothetical protein
MARRVGDGLGLGRRVPGMMAGNKGAQRSEGMRMMSLGAGDMGCMVMLCEDTCMQVRSGR